VESTRCVYRYLTTKTQRLEEEGVAEFQEKRAIGLKKINDLTPALKAGWIASTFTITPAYVRGYLCFTFHASRITDHVNELRFISSLTL
jgi:hypothetical protein